MSSGKKSIQVALLAGREAQGRGILAMREDRGKLEGVLAEGVLAEQNLPIVTNVSEIGLRVRKPRLTEKSNALTKLSMLPGSNLKLSNTIAIHLTLITR
jgi:hypothetical protein